VHLLQWLRQRDRDLVALRRAGRAAIVMPAMFALGEEVIGNPEVATFAAFGSFAMLLLVDFGGPMRHRLQSEAALALVGCVFVCLGTLVSQSVWLATAAMAVVGFGVIFAGVVSSVLAGATTSLLLAFILPATLAGPASAVPDRLAGWAMASGAALLAVGLLWPAPAREPLRSAAARACRALAGRLRAEVAQVRGDGNASLGGELERCVAGAEDAVSALRREFLATPYRPTGLSTSARTIVRLVDEVDWLNAIVVVSAGATDAPVSGSACTVKLRAAMVLELGASLLETMGGDCAALHAAMSELNDALRATEESATSELPVSRVHADADADADAELARREVSAFVTSLDPSFRAQELAFAVSLIAHNIDLTAAAERRSFLQRVLGRQPEGLAGRLSAAQERATAQVDRNSVWLHNSVRGAVGLALAVFVANRLGVQHSFWVVLGTLSVLRSNALSTGQNIVRGLAGTVVGFIIGAAILAVIGTDDTLLWFLLPPVVLLAGVAPAVISFAAGQAAFTLTIVFLFNIIQPTGWRVGLLRVEDVALGCAVSLIVGLLFWPRGAGVALRRALADAYAGSADYLASAVEFGMLRCDSSASTSAEPSRDGARAAAAGRRLDDAFRSYLAERGAKPVLLADVTSLVAGVGGVRLVADAVLDLWTREDGSAVGDRSAARGELLSASTRVRLWYEDFAASLLDGREPRAPLERDKDADQRLVDAVRHDLHGADGKASATAVRMIWTGDHLDAVRRLQRVIVEPLDGGHAWDLRSPHDRRAAAA
jgi:uncharacterized membrane protein YccC